MTFGFNFSQRRRIGMSHFSLLLASSALIVVVILGRDVVVVFLSFIAFFQEGGFANQAQYFDVRLILLVSLHGVLALLVAIVGITFGRRLNAKDGQGSILRWLPTGYAVGKIRQKGNAAWIRNLPDIVVSPTPRFRTYYIEASPEDLSTARDIRSLLRQRNYEVTDDRTNAECDLIVLSPFSDDTSLRNQSKSPPAKPVVYVVSRSMKPQKDVSIALQWIDFRQPTQDLFWKQWERRFSNLKGAHPVFPYVPETLEKSSIPLKYAYGLVLIMIAVAAGMRWFT
jgi:hypothetical protein